MPRIGLFFAVRPPFDAIEQIVRLRRDLAIIRGVLAPDRLHVTLLEIGDYPMVPDRLAARIGTALAVASLPAGRLIFDELVGARDRMLLVASEPLPGVRRLQQALWDALTAAAIRPPRWQDFKPHVTLAYDHCAGLCWPIVPISWQARELLLIASVRGETRHELLARWPLVEPVPQPA